MAASVPVVAAPSIDQRFAQIIRQFGLTKNSFAISLGKTASVVQHLIDGRNKPGFDLMCKVFEIYPNVSRDWLLLGRGPMLIGSSGPAVLPSTPAAPIVPAAPAAPEPGFEPIDLADVAPRASRRPTGLHLQPDEIAATLAMASAAADDSPAAGVSGLPAALGSVAAPVVPHFGTTTPKTPGKAILETPAPTAKKFVLRATQPVSVATAPITEPAAVSEPGRLVASAPEIPASVTAFQEADPHAQRAETQLVPAPASNPEAYVAAAMHAQHLQHQLALAELRNQHLLEQQQMLREMLAMARQSIV